MKKVEVILTKAISYRADIPEKHINNVGQYVRDMLQQGLLPKVDEAEAYIIRDIADNEQKGEV